MSSKDGEPTLAIRQGFGATARKSVAGESVARQFSLSTPCAKLRVWGKAVDALEIFTRARRVRVHGGAFAH
jgi:hypothetical protein